MVCLGIVKSQKPRCAAFAGDSLRTLKHSGFWYDGYSSTIPVIENSTPTGAAAEADAALTSGHSAH